jgi:hypothetical protein
VDGSDVDGGEEDDGEIGGGGGGEKAARLTSRESSVVSPSLPRKSSGAASYSSAEVAGTLAAAALFLERMADRWLTLEAARAVLATFFGCTAEAARPLIPAAAAVAGFTVLAAAFFF